MLLFEFEWVSSAGCYFPVECNIQLDKRTGYDVRLSTAGCRAFFIAQMLLRAMVFVSDPATIVNQCETTTATQRPKSFHT
jgi:hypothetical protein